LARSHQESDQEGLALDPGALAANRAGKLSQGQRSKLWVRATSSLLGFIATSSFAVIAWWVALTGPKVWIAVALLATIAAPIALWAFDRMRADLRGGRVIRVTGVPIVKSVDDENHRIHLELRGRQLRLPASLIGILQQPGQVTAYFTRWSGMLVNIGPAADDD
jgi:hypothetical protein